METKSETREGRRFPSLFWPLILITAGVLLLLDTFGVLNVNIWEAWRLWPLLLILIGLDILVGRRSLLGRIVVLLVSLAAVAAVVVFLLIQPGAMAPAGGGEVDRIQEPLLGVEQASLSVNFLAGELRVGALGEADSLIEGNLDLATSRKPAWSIERSGTEAEMSLQYSRGGASWSWRGRGDEWDLRLSPAVEYSVSVDLGLGDATIDLGGLRITDLDVRSGAGDTEVVLPDRGGYSARIKGGLGDLVLDVPAEVEARIRVDRGLGDLDVASRFRKDGDAYMTAGWEQAEERIDVEIEIGLGQLTIR